MSWLDKYAAEVAQDLKTGVGDITRNAVADIGNRYQEILMADATIKPGDTLPITGDMVHEIAQEAGKAEIEHAIEPPKHDLLNVCARCPEELRRQWARDCARGF